MNKFPITTLYVYDEFTHNVGEYGYNGMKLLSDGLSTTFADAELPADIEGMYAFADLLSNNED